METAHLDTHVVVWLYEFGSDAGLSRAAAGLLYGVDDLRISPIVELEIQFLIEAGKVTVAPDRMIADLQATLPLAAAAGSFSAVVDTARPIAWTRDPFDRLIVAHAQLHDAPLITRDRLIRKHYPKAVW